MTHQPHPWKCPECLHWVPPWAQLHTCVNAISAESSASPSASSASVDATPDATPDASDATAEVAHMSLGSRPKAPRSKSSAYDQGFLDFWSLYPLHRNKRNALKAWRNALARADANAICAGAERYATDANRQAQYTKYAEGWLNADGWLDEPLPPRSLNGQAQRDARAQRERDEEFARKDAEAKALIAKEREGKS